MNRLGNPLLQVFFEVTYGSHRYGLHYQFREKIDVAVHYNTMTVWGQLEEMFQNLWMVMHAATRVVVETD